ncbi:MAG: quinone-dependent dihydroorotate dehydrogenase [Patescibacteria group bacterium]
MLYEKIIRPILYHFQPDTIHPIVAGGSELVSRIPGVSHILRRYFRVNDPALHTTIDGVTYPNPVGLSAGFDKNAQFLHFEETFGFGFAEIGSITGRPYSGNPKPWVRRLVRNESLVVNYGLRSQGVEAVAQRLERTRVGMPYGVSVAKSNLPDCFGETAIADYVKVYVRTKELGRYATINLSCPNTADGTPFSEPETLEPLLQALTETRVQHAIRKPTYLKINPDIQREKLDRIISLVQQYKLQGLVIGNLIKDKARAHALLDYPEDHNLDWPGGVSGKPVRALSTEVIRYVYGKTKGAMTIIGTGGIFTGDHAYEKIRAGASLVQLITGFIFGGPTTIRDINKRLVELLKRDGFRNISEAVGTDQK